MNKFIQKLPIDIVLQIIPYTYNLQNKKLLCDIINYNQTKSMLLELYYNFWSIEMESDDPEEYKNLLINDIFSCANDDEALMYGYVNKFYDIFKRNISLQSKKDIDNYVCNLEKKEVSTQINIFLGLLTTKERNKILVSAFYAYNPFLPIEDNYIV